MATVMKEVLERFLGLRARYPRKTILLQKMDVKSAFRQIPVDPAGAPAFAYVVGEFLVVDLRLQFGWRGSPGWWGLVASAIEHVHRRTTRDTVRLTPSGVRAAAHVRVAPPTGHGIVPIPPQCEVRPAVGGGKDDPAFVRFFVDDAISLEVQWEDKGERCLELTKGLASTHHVLLGERDSEEEPVLPAKKMTDWKTERNTWC